MEKRSDIHHQNFKEWNERMIQKYDPDAFHHHPNPLLRFIERKRVKSILKMVNIKKEDRVIEVGCGAGNIIAKATKGLVFGSDISPLILLKAKNRLNQRANFFLSDAQNLPCKDQAFTKVICSEVLEHILSPLTALSEIRRILKKGGVAVISIPNELLINRLKKIFIRLRIFRRLFPGVPEKMNDEWHLHAYDLGGWLKLFNDSFNISQIRRIPFSWLPLRYVVKMERES